MTDTESPINIRWNAESPVAQAGESKKLLAKLSNLEAEKSLVLVEDEQGWHPSGYHGFGQSLIESEIAGIEVLHEVAKTGKGTLCAALPSGADNPLAFLQGALHCVMVAKGVVLGKSALVYVSRPLAKGLYDQESLAFLERVARGG